MSQIEKLPKNVARFRTAGANLEASASPVSPGSTDQEHQAGAITRFPAAGLIACSSLCVESQIETATCFISQKIG